MYYSSEFPTLEKERKTLRKKELYPLRDAKVNKHQSLLEEGSLKGWLFIFIFFLSITLVLRVSFGPMLKTEEGEPMIGMGVSRREVN